jgi:ornithine cyclodeaminase
MSGALRIIELEELFAALTPAAVIAAVRNGLIRHARGEVSMPSPMQMLFDEPAGDCHIKAGRFRDGECFVVKIATGFYGNPERGLPVNDGLVLVFDAKTGSPQAMIRDRGWLTSWRTAAAGALAAEAGMPAGTRILGIIGTGHQARLQAEWVTRHLGIGSVVVFGRSVERADVLAEDLRRIGLTANVAPSIDALCESSRLVVTCTPSNDILLPAGAVRAGTHIVALGADSPGKQELDPVLFARAAAVMVDDRDQCADHGDLSHAVRRNLLTPDAAIVLGSVLAGNRPYPRSSADITIADLTGTAAQDVAIASLALSVIDGAHGSTVRS